MVVSLLWVFFGICNTNILDIKIAFKIEISQADWKFFKKIIFIIFQKINCCFFFLLHT